MKQQPKAPKVLRPRPWRFPRADAHELPNGLQVLVYHRPGQYVVSAGLALDLPLNAEPGDREGVAALVARSLDEGTAQHPGVSFVDAIENCGAALDVYVGYAGTQVYLDVPASRLPESLRLLAEAVSTPELTDTDIERQRGLRLAQIEQQLATASERADHAFRRTVIQRRYRAARMRSGEADTLARVTGADARAFHAAHYGPSLGTLVLAGDFPTDPMPAVIEAFGDWHNPEQTFVDHEAPQPRNRHLYLIDRPGSVQADVRLGGFTIDRADPGWADLQVATHAIGGAFLSRLNRVLREERGYTYGVHIMNAPMRDGGYTTVQGSFRNEVVADAVSMIPELLDVTGRPLTADEVSTSRDFLAGVQPMRFSTASGVCNGVMSLLAAGLTSDFVDALREAYFHVTPESATRAVAELLPPERLSLVIVGDAGVLRPGLRKAGWKVRVLGQGEWI